VQFPATGGLDSAESQGIVPYLSNSLFILYLLLCVADPDPGSGAFLRSVSGNGKNQEL
jgi:hypothetical protein